MYKIKSFDLGSVALYSFLLYLILGLIILLPVGLLMSVLSGFMQNTGEFDLGIFPFLSGIFIFIIPIFYAVLGTIFNLVIAVIYNLLSKKFGGIKLEIENVDEAEKYLEY